MNTAKKPNLIYVFADQLRYFSMGYTGDQNALTPNIDALCKDSINLCQTVSGIRFVRRTGRHCLRGNTRRARGW